MTMRTMNPQKTPIELATENIIHALSGLVTVAYAEYNVKAQIRDEATFRGIIAGYFEQKSLRDWCLDLGIDPPEHAHDVGGEG